ncbi:hypothetical protein [Mesorhizobium sp.]|uniref:hypothetical protein n=1 Tax=Mesorhizobium sp. TaxID=1871066 RepID=UPI000FE6FFEE|nr:hypothetical protein [Mesorhizobium sp.]RWP05084.1 MAG: hypothetical protein EOQ99_16570 [Mesorhizobium sp.]
MTEARQLSLFKGRRQRGVKPPPPPEFKTHVAVADALRHGCSPGWLWTHFPAGEERPGFKDKKGRRVSPSASRLKRMGLKRGWSDFLLIDPAGRHYWLELKRGRAGLTEDQEAFRDACWARDVPWALARSFDEAIAQLASWGAVRVKVSA